MDKDLELIRRCEAGEREAFDALVMKYQKQLYSMLYRMVSNHEDASDILQKTFVNAFSGLKGFRKTSSFRTWLYRIAVNLAKNLYRERSRTEQVPLDSVVIGSNPGTLESVIQEERRQMLRCYLEILPEKQRLTLMLRVQEGLAFAEIAKVMRCSTGTAKANYHHAVRKLKHLFAAKKPQGEKE